MFRTASAPVSCNVTYLTCPIFHQGTAFSCSGVVHVCMLRKPQCRSTAARTARSPPYSFAFTQHAACTQCHGIANKHSCISCSCNQTCETSFNLPFQQWQLACVRDTRVTICVLMSNQWSYGRDMCDRLLVPMLPTHISVRSHRSTSTRLCQSKYLGAVTVRGQDSAVRSAPIAQTHGQTDRH